MDYCVYRKDTKTKKPRIIYLYGELKELIQQQWDLREKNGITTPYVFTNAEGTGPLGDFRKAWNTARRKAKIGYGYAESKEYAKH